MTNGNDLLPYEEEAQELITLLKQYYSKASGMVQGILDLVIDDEQDTIALLDFIKSDKADADTIYDYAEELYDAHEHDE